MSKTYLNWMLAPVLVATSFTPLHAQNWFRSIDGYFAQAKNRPEAILLVQCDVLYGETPSILLGIFENREGLKLGESLFGGTPNAGLSFSITTTDGSGSHRIFVNGAGGSHGGELLEMYGVARSTSFAGGEVRKSDLRLLQNARSIVVTAKGITLEFPSQGSGKAIGQLPCAPSRSMANAPQKPTVVTPASSGFGGTYSGAADGGDLMAKITKLSRPNTYNVQLEAFGRQGCSGQLSGIANAHGNKLSLEVPYNGGRGLCVVEFTRQGKILSTSEDDCASFHGMSCSFDRGKLTPD